MKVLSEQPVVGERVESENARFGSYVEIGEYSYLENVEFGDYSYSGPFCFFQNATIRKFANIAASVRVGPTMHPVDRPTLHHFTYRRVQYGFDREDDKEFFQWRREQRTEIGNDTWIGHGAIIMPGVEVGDGAVIGAGAVVTKDVEPYAIVVGVPAREIKRRFEPEVIEAMLQIAWWDWPYAKIKERLADFAGSTEAFVKKYGKVKG